MIRSAAIILSAGILFSASSMLVTNIEEGSLTPQQLVDAFIDETIVVDSISLTATDISAGIYSDALVEAQGSDQMTSGIVLSSGSVSYLNNTTNTSDDITSYLLFTDNDPDLQSLIGSGQPVYDATILEFDFTPQLSGSASFMYVFGSDEYDEYVNEFNDVFGFFLDGENVATLPNSTVPVSINTVNVEVNTSYFNQNDIDYYDSIGMPIQFATEMDGFTVPLTVSFDVTAEETYHLKLGVADARDFQLDSWVLLGEGSFSVTPTPQPVPEPALFHLLITVFGLLLLVTCVQQKKQRQQ